MVPSGSRALRRASSGWERTASPTHEGATTRILTQWPDATSPVRRYSVPQYGQRDSRVASIGRYTRGCLFHSFCEGSGQCRGRSAPVTSTDFFVSFSGADGCMFLVLDRGEPVVVLAVLAVDDVEEGVLQLLRDR